MAGDQDSWTKKSLPCCCDTKVVIATTKANDLTINLKGKTVELKTLFLTARFLEKSGQCGFTIKTFDTQALLLTAGAVDAAMDDQQYYDQGQIWKWRWGQAASHLVSKKARKYEYLVTG